MSTLTQSAAPSLLRTWWAAQKERPNYGELAQALLRVSIGVILLGAYYAWVDGREQPWVSYLCWGFVALSFVLFGLIYRARTSSDLIRFVTLLVDLGTPTILLGLTGERSVILVFVYTWVAVGHGFRFGLRYLHIAWVASLVAMVGVYALSAHVQGFWYQHPMLWVGAFIWTAAPTFYVARLLRRIAAQAAEEARVRAERTRAEAERERVERARVQAERARADAEAANEAKSEYLAIMSHEMRTPLNGVVGAAEMLATKPLLEQERRLLDWLLVSSRQLQSLIDNLLDLRKVETGKVIIETAPLDLHALMNRLVALFEPDAKRTSLRFTKAVSAEAPYLLLGDEQRIMQVLINLTANALKFTKAGFVRVSVSAAEDAGNQAKLRFEVRDTGIGIAPEHAAHIFERFAQADSSIQREYGGSGLGTTISKHLVELMRGEIGFDSTPGQGSLFWFTVPLPLQPSEAWEGGAGVSLRGCRIIIVSSRPGIDHWMAQAARTRQLECIEARDLDEMLALAIRRGGATPIAIVINGEDDSLDWRKAVGAVTAAGCRLPCILWHAGASEQEAFDAGYVSLIKGREPGLIARALRSVVAGAASMAQGGEDPVASPKRPGLHVLVAEDNKISQQIISMILRGGGHQVITADDGESALDQYQHVSFDLVILDMNMPGRDGLELAKAIRVIEATGRTRRVPIVMLTAAARVELRADAAAAGIDLFLGKPIEPHALLEAVDQAHCAIERSLRPDAGAELSQPGPYVDHALIDQMSQFSSDPAFVQTLARTFSADAQELVEEIAHAADRRDVQQLQELAHALKGAAMMAGAVRLSGCAARIEQIIDPRLQSGTDAAIRDLRETWAATRARFYEMLEPQATR